MSHLNYMWCLTISSLWPHSWHKSKFLHIGQILCKPSHKAAHQIILTSRILGSLYILRNTSEKLQDTNWSSLHRITNNHSPNQTYKRFRPERKHQPLNWKAFGFQGSSQSITIRESWFCSTTIQCSQWDTSPRGRKVIFRVRRKIKNS